MLHTETVSKGTLELITDLMNDTTLHEFFLVGGTALSLLIGHRISIDIDLFSQNHFDENKLSIHLENTKGLMVGFLARGTIKGQINHVQVDFIAHQYPLVQELTNLQNIRIASLEDIAAMKLNAIAGNGTRLKDFVDIAFMSSYLSLHQMTDAYEKKYSSRNAVMILKALSFYNDINFNEPIRFVSGKYEWKSIARRLKEMIQSEQKVFSSSPF